VDLCVGLPSDVLLYATLMHLIGKDTGLTPAYLSFSFGDCHVYANHIRQWQEEQAPREIISAPKLVLAEQATTLNFEPAFAALEDYVYHPAIKYAFNA